MRPDDGRVVSNFLTQALAGKPITIYGDGSQTRSFCYVDDEVRGILALLDSDYAGPVNIGNPDEYTVLELADDGAGGHRLDVGRWCSSPSPSTTRGCAGPTSPWPGGSSAGSPRCRSARAWPAPRSGSRAVSDERWR